jgi:predicted transcriptional regulator
VILLAIARHPVTLTGSQDTVRAATIRVDDDVALVLEALAERVGQGAGAAASAIGSSLASFERSMAALVAAAGAHVTRTGVLELYRELAVAVDRLAASSARSIHPTTHPIVAA